MISLNEGTLVHARKERQASCMRKKMMILKMNFYDFCEEIKDPEGANKFYSILKDKDVIYFFHISLFFVSLLSLYLLLGYNCSSLAS